MPRRSWLQAAARDAAAARSTTCRSASSTRGAARSPTSRACSPSWRGPTSSFVGEQHDDPNTHRLELALLEGCGAAASPAVVSLRCSSATCRSRSSTTCAGTIGEASSSRSARPWPRYATDYRPLVEFAKREGWPVVAANVPRRIASAVAKIGAGRRSSSCRRRIGCCRRASCSVRSDAYFDRFAGDERTRRRRRRDRPAAARRPTSQRATTDATTGRSASRTRRWRSRSPRRSPTGAGKTRPDRALQRRVPQRLRRRHRRAHPPPPAGQQVAVVSMLPVADLDRSHRRRRSQARGLSGLHGEVSSGLGFADSGLQVYRRSEHRCRAASASCGLATAGAASSSSSRTPSPRAPSPEPASSFQPLRHVRDHVRHDRDRGGERCDMSRGSILSTVSAGVWWIRK